jgi:hypothetical protein
VHGDRRTISPNQLFRRIRSNLAYGARWNVDSPKQSMSLADYSHVQLYLHRSLLLSSPPRITVSLRSHRLCRSPRITPSQTPSMDTTPCGRTTPARSRTHSRSAAPSRCASLSATPRQCSRRTSRTSPPLRQCSRCTSRTSPPPWTTWSARHERSSRTPMLCPRVAP